MSRIVEVQGLRIGEGQPKICVPVVAENIEEIKKQANAVMYTPADIVEWRVDCLRSADDSHSVMVALGKLRSKLSGKPVLFTFRTAAEGGQKDISAEKYVSLCTDAINSGKIELIDVEYMLGRNVTDVLIKRARAKGVKVILSSHDFTSTPPVSEMEARLKAMKKAGADIAKIAVMPQNPSDVLALLKASDDMRQDDDMIPFITVSMAAAGSVSRIAGEVFGSAVTFASAGKASAPGQMDADELDRTMSVLHRALAGARCGQRAERASGGNIILIGFMGTGKTTVSRKIAEKTGYPVKELDEIIEKNMGMTIKQIFNDYGEEYFRDLETETIKEASRASGTVISCGGGAVLRPENVAALRSSGSILLLRARPETVLERVRKNGDRRPVLSKYQSRGYISWLMKRRSDAYEKAADYVIDVDGRSTADIADEIIDYMGIK